MFARTGHTVVKHWKAVLIGWVILLVIVFAVTPRFFAQVTDGEFAFLPAEAPSLEAERLFREAFSAGQVSRTPGNGVASDDETAKETTVGGSTESEAEAGNENADGEDRSGSTQVQQNPLGSNIVIVLHRADPLTDADYEFIDSVLVPTIERAAEELRRNDEQSRLGAVWTYKDRKIGELLVSNDKKATLVLLELTTEFLDRTNGELIAKVEELINSDKAIDESVPAGLELTLSGSATVGRDMLRAEAESGQRTETFTFLVVIGLLAIIYRAPLIAIVPLVTVAAASLVALRLLALLASWNVIEIFRGLEVYVRVVMYGAGVDYCLFLIARYREGLSEGRDYPGSLTESVSRVGSALATSAGTSVIGIGMMMTAEFGKFRQAGFGIAFGLAIVLFAALTFAPAVLAMLESAAFWPDNRHEKAVESDGPLGRVVFASRIRLWLNTIWEDIAVRIERQPAAWLLVGVGILMPFALIAPHAERHLSYGLLSDLPKDEPSVRGAVAVQEHFPAGVTGPITVLVKSDALVDETPREISETLTEALMQHAEELKLADVRSQSDPLGVTPKAQEFIESTTGGGRRGIIARNAMRVQARKVFLSNNEEYPGTVMRLDLIFRNDPFDREAIAQITAAETLIRESLPANLKDSVSTYLLGPTSSIRDLKAVTDVDQRRIHISVSVAVYVIIVLLLRRFAVCLFLIASVIFSYLATVGLTYTTFYLLDPAGFAGLDWKIPIFLFTLLIALGEDYNILLMARIVEEQQQHGPLNAVRIAMGKTGGIISSCGLIMAGTFAALMSGTLLGMVQLGFALTSGVLIDTFIVRPVIVPAWLMLLNSGRLGKLGVLLGAELESTAETEADAHAVP